MPRTAPQQDISALLKQDHKDVKGMFQDFAGLGERAVARRRDLGTKICAALATHSKIEKQILYPAFKDRAEGHDELQQVLEAFEEHAIVDELVEQIQGMAPADETYEAKVMTLFDLVDHHVKEEEGEFFPTTRELFEKNELVEMAGQAQAMKSGTTTAAR
jgi:hemerythrin superfamily protein